MIQKKNFRGGERVTLNGGESNAPAYEPSTPSTQKSDEPPGVAGIVSMFRRSGRPLSYGTTDRLWLYSDGRIEVCTQAEEEEWEALDSLLRVRRAEHGRSQSS